MWSAFEALLPPPTKDERSARITHFADLIAPAVVRKYIKGKYRIFLDDVTRHSSADIKSMMGDETKPEDMPKKFFDVLIDNTEDCDRLFAAVSDSTLMLSRINQLFELAKNHKAISHKMESHEKRVRWQIHRIYRERNAIVHAGRSTPALPVLVENSFLYYRLVMRAIQVSWVKYGIYQPHGALQLIAGGYSTLLSDFKELGNIENKEERRDRAKDLIFS